MAISIVLADDHFVVRQGLRRLLEAATGFQIVGEAENGIQALELVEQLHPDVLVADLKMPGMSGIEIARQVRRHSSRTRVVILSMYGETSYVVEALRAGVKAYILKDSSGDEVLQGIRAAAANQRYLATPLSERAIEAYSQTTEYTALEPHETLTPREREVLYLLSEGCKNAEIAKRLCVSRRTVEGHRLNLMRKLGLHSQAEIVRYALQHEILPQYK
jgi:two-component system response regulator NreC